MSSAKATKSAAPAGRGRPWLLGGIAGAILLALATGGVLLARGLAHDEVTDLRADAAGEAEAIQAAKMAVQARLPAATSLAFGKVFVNWVGERPAVCGVVDIDEPEDSFERPEKFTWLDGRLQIEQVDGTAALDQAWPYLCRSTG